VFDRKRNEQSSLGQPKNQFRKRQDAEEIEQERRRPGLSETLLSGFDQQKKQIPRIEKREIRTQQKRERDRKTSKQV
jgi:hypothetical protein